MRGLPTVVQVSGFAPPTKRRPRLRPQGAPHRPPSRAERPRPLRLLSSSDGEHLQQRQTPLPVPLLFRVRPRQQDRTPAERLFTRRRRPCWPRWMARAAVPTGEPPRHDRHHRVRPQHEDLFPFPATPRWTRRARSWRRSNRSSPGTALRSMRAPTHRSLPVGLLTPRPAALRHILMLPLKGTPGSRGCPRMTRSTNATMRTAWASRRTAPRNIAARVCERRHHLEPRGPQLATAGGADLATWPDRHSRLAQHDQVVARGAEDRDAKERVLLPAVTDGSFEDRVTQAVRAAPDDQQ